jgi:hypothetical protein
MTVDTIHTTPRGGRRLAEITADQVRGCAADRQVKILGVEPAGPSGTY